VTSHSDLSFGASSRCRSDPEGVAELDFSATAFSIATVVLGPGSGAAGIAGDAPHDCQPTHTSARIAAINVIAMDLWCMVARESDLAMDERDVPTAQAAIDTI
jgi:hypothetical protein